MENGIWGVVEDGGEGGEEDGGSVGGMEPSGKNGWCKILRL